MRVLFALLTLATAVSADDWFQLARVAAPGAQGHWKDRKYCVGTEESCDYAANEFCDLRTVPCSRGLSFREIPTDNGFKLEAMSTDDGYPSGLCIDNLGRADEDYKKGTHTELLACSNTDDVWQQVDVQPPDNEGRESFRLRECGKGECVYYLDSGGVWRDLDKEPRIQLWDNYNDDYWQRAPAKTRFKTITKVKIVKLAAHKTSLFGLPTKELVGTGVIDTCHSTEPLEYDFNYEYSSSDELSSSLETSKTNEFTTGAEVSASVEGGAFGATFSASITAKVESTTSTTVTKGRTTAKATEKARSLNVKFTLPPGHVGMSAMRASNKKVEPQTVTVEVSGTTEDGKTVTDEPMTLRINSGSDFTEFGIKNWDFKPYKHQCRKALKCLEDIPQFGIPAEAAWQEFEKCADKYDRAKAGKRLKSGNACLDVAGTHDPKESDRDVAMWKCSTNDKWYFTETDGKSGQLRRKGSDMCLDVVGDDAQVVRSQKVEVYPCSLANDTWKLREDGRIQRLYSEMCLDIPGNHPAAVNNDVQMWDCDSDDPTKDFWTCVSTHPPRGRLILRQVAGVSTTSSV